MKLLKGYVKNRTKEVALAAVLGALIIIGRYITIPVFIPPMRGLEVSSCFYSVALIVLSYPYVWLIALILGITASVPLPSFVIYLLGSHTFYFICKLIGLEKAKYFSAFDVFLNGFYGIIIFDLLGLIPWKLSLIPLLVKCTAQGAVAFIIVPILIKVLKELSVIEVQ